MLGILSLIGYYLLAILTNVMYSGGHGYAGPNGWGARGNTGGMVFEFAATLCVQLLFAYYYLTIVKKYAA